MKKLIVIMSISVALLGYGIAISTGAISNKSIGGIIAYIDSYLGNVDNTSDVNKPVSSAQQTALDLKSNIDSPTFTTQITTPKVTNAAALALGSTAAGVNITIHSDATDDFTVGGTKLVVEGDSGEVGVGLADPTDELHVHATTGTTIRITDNTTGASATDGAMIQQTGVNSYLWNWETGDLYLGTDGSTDMTIQTGGNVGIGETSPAGKLHIDTTGYDEGLIIAIPDIASLPDAGYTQAPVITWQGGETKFGKWRNFFNGYEMGWGLSYNAKWNYDDNTWEGRDIGDSRTNMCAMLRFNVAEGNIGGELLELNFAQGANAGVAPDWNSSSDYFFFASSTDNNAPTMFHMRAPGNCDVTIRMAPDEGGDASRMQLRNAADNIFYIENLEYGSTSYANPFAQITETIIGIEVDGRDVGIGHASPTADLHIQGNLSQALSNAVTNVGTAVASISHGLWTSDVIGLPTGADGTEEVFLVAAVPDVNNLILDSVPTNDVTGKVGHTDSDLFKITNADNQDQLSIDKHGIWTFDANIKHIAKTIYLADEGTIALETGSVGVGAVITYHAFGWLVVGNNEERTQFWVDHQGGVTLVGNSANIVANADTEGKICINIAAAPAEPVYLRNKMGSAKQISWVMWYF